MNPCVVTTCDAARDSVVSSPSPASGGRGKIGSLQKCVHGLALQEMVARHAHYADYLRVPG